MIRTTIIACALLLTLGSAARGQDQFYAIVFGEQDGRNRINQAHSFATFVRVRLEAAGPEVVERATISWLPAAGRVRLFKRAERGRNYSLEETFAMVKPGHTVAQWGPFEIREELFQRAKRQEAFLSSGGVLYKAMDPFTRPAGIAINCEHAISDIGLNPGESIIRTGTAHGHDGSYLVATHLHRWMIEPGVAHEWVNASLKLDQYAIAKGGGWDYQGPGRATPPGMTPPGMERPGVAVAGGTAASDTVTRVAAEQEAEERSPTVQQAGR